MDDDISEQDSGARSCTQSSERLPGLAASAGVMSALGTGKLDEAGPFSLFHKEELPLGLIFEDVDDEDVLGLGRASMISSGANLLKTFIGAGKVLGLVTSVYFV